MTAALADYASAYAAIGLRPLALARNSKVPVWNDWPRMAPTTPEAARQLFGHHHGNIGITFPPELFAIDLDRKGNKDGIAAIEAIAAEHGGLPRTLTQRTPSGSEHRIFRKPPGIKLPNKVDGIAAGIDVRSEGGQIACEPSAIDGKPYQWLDWSPMDGEIPEIADAPKWLLDRLLGEDLSAPQSTPARTAQGAKLLEGGRNDALFRDAAAMRRRGFDEEAIAAALMVRNRNDCCPPLSDDEVKTIAASAAKYQPEEDPSTGKERTRAGFPFVQARDLLSKPEPIKYLIQDVMECNSLASLFGASGSGKSFLAIDWACCVATGRDWNGKATERGAVFYIAGEGHAGIRRRLKAWEIHTGTSLQDAPLFVSTCPAALMDSGNATSVANAVELLAAQHGTPTLIVIDTLARNFGNGDENSNADVGQFINNIDVRLRTRFYATILIVHHTGHLEKDRARGASALRAALDSEYRLDHVGDIRALICTKAKESEPPRPMSFNLEQIVLDGWADADGELMTSAVLVPSAETPKAKDKGLRGANRIALDALTHALQAEGKPTPEPLRAAIGFLAPEKVVHEDVWRQRAYNEGISDGAPDGKRKAFGRSRKALLDMKMVSTWGDLYWLGGMAPDGAKVEEIQTEQDTGQGETKRDICPGSCAQDGTDRDTLL
jgi:hypothetical protein